MKTINLPKPAKSGNRIRKLIQPGSPLRRARADLVADLIRDEYLMFRMKSDSYESMSDDSGLTKGEIDRALDDLVSDGRVVIRRVKWTLVAMMADDLESIMACEKGEVIV